MNASLILSHKNIDHIYNLVQQILDSNFYIHINLKVNFVKIKKATSNIGNIFCVENRVDSKWARYSIVKDILNLMNYILQQDTRNKYFYLINSDDVILINEQVWDDSTIYMEYVGTGLFSRSKYFFIDSALSNILIKGGWFLYTLFFLFFKREKDYRVNATFIIFVCFYFYENIFNGNLLLSIFLFMNFYNLLSKSYSLKNIG
ncbi:oligosaccharide biosynthesis glycosyltransferase Gtr3 [Acinetobacter baumannii]|uniref:oligosaccharide biosynthesis glycosyltransferase Gtr3 n=1 Tax=Acinetobacter baumannii TaxID=470 RepID=UPI001360ECBC|nr:oligosaccharide biosynthesis glycosyltransferase Gtr3 [Acinetobacter baumannii]NAO23204.1 glycogen branching protein [Acinetobacter baumannii]